MERKFDPAIGAAWEQRVAGVQKSRKRRWIILGILAALLIVPVAVGILPPLPYLPALMLMMLALATAIRYGYARHLQCPNCGKPPEGRWGRSSFQDVDYCAHCHCWLRNPRRGGRQGLSEGEGQRAASPAGPETMKRR